MVSLVGSSQDWLCAAKFVALKMLCLVIFKLLGAFWVLKINRYFYKVFLLSVSGDNAKKKGFRYEFVKSALSVL